MRQTVNRLAASRPAIFLKKQLLALIALTQRYPWVIALYGFVSGVASFVLVDRQARLAAVVAILMLASWLFLMLESAFNQRLAEMFDDDLSCCKLVPADRRAPPWQRLFEAVARLASPLL